MPAIVNLTSLLSDDMILLCKLIASCHPKLLGAG